MKRLQDIVAGLAILAGLALMVLAAMKTVALMRDHRVVAVFGWGE